MKLKTLSNYQLRTKLQDLIDLNKRLVSFISYGDEKNSLEIVKLINLELLKIGASPITKFVIDKKIKEESNESEN